MNRERQNEQASSQAPLQRRDICAMKTPLVCTCPKNGGNSLTMINVPNVSQLQEIKIHLS